MKGEEVAVGVLKILYRCFCLGEVPHRKAVAEELGVSLRAAWNAHQYWRQRGITRTRGEYIELTAAGAAFCQENGLTG